MISGFLVHSLFSGYNLSFTGREQVKQAAKLTPTSPNTRARARRQRRNALSGRMAGRYPSPQQNLICSNPPKKSKMLLKFSLYRHLSGGLLQLQFCCGLGYRCPHHGSSRSWFPPVHAARCVHAVRYDVVRRCPRFPPSREGRSTSGMVPRHRPWC